MLPPPLDVSGSVFFLVSACTRHEMRLFTGLVHEQAEGRARDGQFACGLHPSALRRSS